MRLTTTHLCGKQNLRRPSSKHPAPSRQRPTGKSAASITRTSIAISHGEISVPRFVSVDLRITLQGPLDTSNSTLKVQGLTPRRDRCHSKPQQPAITRLSVWPLPRLGRIVMLDVAVNFCFRIGVVRRFRLHFCDCGPFLSGVRYPRPGHGLRSATAASPDLSGSKARSGSCTGHKYQPRKARCQKRGSIRIKADELAFSGLVLALRAFG